MDINLGDDVCAFGLQSWGGHCGEDTEDRLFIRVT